MKNKTVLLIDDDAGFLYLTSLLFKKAGATILTARGGLEGISKLFAHQPDLIVLDVTMPDMDGFEALKRIRQISDAPIIILTGLDDEQQKLRWFEAGADDYVAKPFKPKVLLARARSALRQNESLPSQTNMSNYNDGYLSIDFERGNVFVNGQKIRLTPIQFHLLTYLVRNAGKLVPFQEILANVWGNQHRGNVGYVHVYISQLRTKLKEDPKHPRYILTVHGIGYLFQNQHLSDHEDRIEKIESHLGLSSD